MGDLPTSGVAVAVSRSMVASRRAPRLAGLHGWASATSADLYARILVYARGVRGAADAEDDGLRALEVLSSGPAAWAEPGLPVDSETEPATA